jgi:hypothetical protein
VERSRSMVGGFGSMVGGSGSIVERSRSMVGGFDSMVGGSGSIVERTPKPACSIRSPWRRRNCYGDGIL